MSLDAAALALQMEERFGRDLREIRIGSFRVLRAEVHGVLSRYPNARQMNNVHRLLRDEQSKSVLRLGPTIDEGPTDSHFRLQSGWRLSFGITVTANDELVAYRFHVQRKRRFLRFDLNTRKHSDPLREPRSHLHPGDDGVRLPFPVMHPVQLLHHILYGVCR